MVILRAKHKRLPEIRAFDFSDLQYRLAFIVSDDRFTFI